MKIIVSTIMIFFLITGCGSNPNKMYQDAKLELKKNTVESKKKAFELFSKASAMNHPDSTFYLAECYSKGWGTSINKKLAKETYKKSTSLGHTQGSFIYGNQLVQENDKEAYKVFTELDKKGHIESTVILANLYLYGNAGAPQDGKKSFELYSKAASQGNLTAIDNLGFFYQSGEYVKKDEEKALKYYLEAAEKEHMNAQYKASYMYYYGVGTPKDLQKTIYWSDKAMKNGAAKPVYYDKAKKELKQ